MVFPRMPLKAMTDVRCVLMLQGLHELGQLVGKSSYGMPQGGENDWLVDWGRGEAVLTSVWIWSIWSTSMQAAVSIPSGRCILRCTYSEGSVFGFLMREFHRVPVSPIDSEDDFDTLWDTDFFRVWPILLCCRCFGLRFWSALISTGRQFATRAS
jgi:hypothetical protein